MHFMNLMVRKDFDFELGIMDTFLPNPQIIDKNGLHILDESRDIDSK